MPKYTEKNVVKIKQDVAKESKKLTDAIAKRIAEEKELRRLQALTRVEEQKVSKIWETANTGLLIANTAKKTLETDCEGLRADKGVLESQVALWRDLLAETIQNIGKATEKRRPLFIDSLISESQKILSNLVSQTTAEETRLSALKEELESLEKKSDALKIHESAASEKVALLDADIEKKRRVIATLETGRSDLERREQNVEAMEIRLTPEFQALYRGHKKKKDAVQH